VYAREHAQARLFSASICDFALYLNSYIAFNYSVQNGCFLYDDEEENEKDQQEQQHQQR
jgi:hypothetical protein